jgi:hypothetical protein
MSETKLVNSKSKVSTSAGIFSSRRRIFPVDSPKIDIGTQQEEEDVFLIIVPHDDRKVAWDLFIGGEIRLQNIVYIHNPNLHS